MNINIQQTKKIISKSRVMTYKKGFTLVEMLVSVVIFSCVVTMAVGILVTVMNANKHVRSTSMSVGFVNTVLEKMFRAVSAGTHYRCDDGSVFYAYIDENESSGNLPPGQKNKLGEEQTCSDFKEVFIFEGVDGDTSTPDDQIIYIFHGNTIKRSDNGGDSYESLIDGDVAIEDF
ncbi:MAG: prepilin-type N-terminal cleavage/methylation domain-containing protein, partial [Candidatus Pacebacteria bacterium]|nr:prepilin-type N-terminal cleavage/methylation domain-containing protein [Candidatus Paceibacterota bacterium]